MNLVTIDDPHPGLLAVEAMPDDHPGGIVEYFEDAFGMVVSFSNSTLANRRWVLIQPVDVNPN